MAQGNMRKYAMLIAVGVVAAGALVSVSLQRNTIKPEDTQGAIGKRDVYREGDSAKVAVAQTGAPVAVRELLKASPEFKTLAKDQAFQSLLPTRVSRTW